MTPERRVHPAGAHLYVIISPDAEDAESSVDAAVVEVLDELGSQLAARVARSGAAAT